MIYIVHIRWRTCDKKKLNLSCLTLVSYDSELCSVLSLGLITCCQKLKKGMLMRYPTMHYFKNPRDTQSMITYIWCWRSISKNSSEKLHCGNVVNMPYCNLCILMNITWHQNACTELCLSLSCNKLIGEEWGADNVWAPTQTRTRPSASWTKVLGLPLTLNYIRPYSLINSQWVRLINYHLFYTYELINFII